MTKDEAIELIRGNTYNIQLVPKELIDLQLIRFVYHRNPWAAEAYCPKGLKNNWIYVVCDHVIKFEFEDII